MKDKKLIYENEIRNLIKNFLFESPLNERLGTDPEGLAYKAPTGLHNKTIGPQSNRDNSTKFDQPGPDPESDLEELEGTLEPAIDTIEIVSLGSGISSRPSDDIIEDEGYIPANPEELKCVVSSLMADVANKDIEQTWNSIVKTLKELEG